MNSAVSVRCVTALVASEPQARSETAMWGSAIIGCPMLPGSR